MKILFIQPSSIKSRKSNKRLIFKIHLHPSLTFEQLSGITPGKHEIDFIDERYQKIYYEWKGDIVGISCMTAEALRAYKIADRFRKKGLTVVLGGWHPSALPEEAKKHADSILIGEAEIIWPELLKDFENGKLKPFYANKSPIDISNIPLARRNIRKCVSFTAGVQASRGCTMGCEFCAISNSRYGRVHRKRKIEKIIDEIDSIKQKYLFFFDPSLTINPSFAKELFRAMRGLNKKFKCFGNIDILGKDDELLKLSAEAGCSVWFVGIESFSQKTLNTIGKSSQVKDYDKIIKKIHDYGIAVFSSMIFGFDTDTIDVFDKAVEKVYDLDIDIAGFSILTPYPGTPLFNRLDKEKRIISYDWSKYDEDHVVFQPKNMTPEDLLFNTEQVRKQVNSLSGISRRILKSKNLKIQKISPNSFLYI